MPRHVRPRYAAIASHAISNIDPVLAAATVDFLGHHIVPPTQSTYDSATRQYLRFCSVRGISPWPPDAVWIVAWIVDTTMRVSVGSMKVYLAGVRSATINKGMEWELRGNALVARALRAAKRKYGEAGSALKVPISLFILRKMCVRIPGWPRADLMDFDDVLFVSASCIAVLGFLRGGEFLASSRAYRPLLRTSDVCLVESNSGPYVTVRIVQPKARWWLADAVVTCFDPGPLCPLSPPVWLAHYRARLGAVSASSPAFVMANGKPLSKAWMLSRTTELLRRADVSLLDSVGAPVAVKASSWRAGGVQSAQQAGISDGSIRALGRWASSAWMNYCFTSTAELREAAVAMGRASNAGSATLVVGAFSSAGLF